MGIKELQAFIDTQCEQACKPVDLLQCARVYSSKRRRGKGPNPGCMCLVVDVESCLDRLYGGFYSDWVCGGQWNRMLQFLTNLSLACRSAQMDMLMFFNGALEIDRLEEWASQQMETKTSVAQVMKHIHNKATPPPKVWWIPPACLKSCLRLALRHLGIPTAHSLEDHHQEVIAFCRQNSYQGIVAQDAEYAIFDPPKYYSSHFMKLTFKGALETKEYDLDEVARSLDLNPDRFCVLAALLGNHILTEADLSDFHSSLTSFNGQGDNANELQPSDLMRAIVQFLKMPKSVEDLDEIGKLVFKNSSDFEKKIAKLKQSVQYYMNGTKDGFLKCKPNKKPFVPSPVKQPGSYPVDKPKKKEDDDAENDTDEASNAANVHSNDSIDNKEITIPSQGAVPVKNEKENRIPNVDQEIMRIACERHAQGLMSPWVYQILTQGEVKLSVALEDEGYRELPSPIDLFRKVRQKSYAVLFDLNKTRLQAKNPNFKNDGTPKYTEIIIKEWMVKCGGQGAVYGGTGSQLRYEMVRAETLEWKCPSLHRLWLGQAVEDKNRRIRAFLTCFGCDITNMLNTSYVPQHFLLLCCVLRYMVLYNGSRILRRHELDAFLATAVSPILHDVEVSQEMKLPMITPRGVQLASLFMHGIETAIYINDVCGAPFQWTMCCPWTFFDGKLFHYKLLKANNNTPLLDICDGQVDQVMKLERMRQVILEGIPTNVPFAHPSLPTMPQGQGYYSSGMNFRPAGAPAMPPNQPQGKGRGRGLLGRSPVDQRGGQLQIAGVVVGNWGGNTQQPKSRGRGTHVAPPHVTAIGPRRGGQGRGIVSSPVRGGRGKGNYMNKNTNTRQNHGNLYNVGGKRKGKISNKGKEDITKITLEQRTKEGSGRGRGCTVETYEDGPNVVSVSQLMKEEDSDQTKDDHMEELTGQFEDVLGGLGTKDMNGFGVQSPLAFPGNFLNPDSGIQADGDNGLEAVD